MRLIHKATQTELKVGDAVQDRQSYGFIIVGWTSRGVAVLPDTQADLTPEQTLTLAQRFDADVFGCELQED
jgi:hypothetical protein